MGDYMKLIYENMSVDEFMKRYNALFDTDTEWYKRKLKRPFLIDTDSNFDDPVKLITFSDFAGTLDNFDNAVSKLATDVFGEIDIPLIGSFDFGNLLDIFCPTFDATRVTIEKMYMEDELEKLYNMIDESPDGVAYYDRRYFKYA